MSQQNTQSQEKQFRAWQLANGVNRQKKQKQSSWLSPQEVISQRYGLPSRKSCDNFLKNNTLILNL